MESDQWLGVEVRHLAALAAIVEEGSFGRAAARLGYTQSAISQQIATLERIVGERLLDRPRGKRTVRATEAGELLVRHGNAIVARLRAAQADIEALAHGEGSRLRVGTFQSTGARVLPELMRRFGGEWPSVDVRLTEFADDAVLLEMLERGELDVAFAQLPLDDRPLLDVQPLLVDPYVLVIPADEEAPAEPLSIKKLDGQKLIGFRTCRSQPMAEEQLEQRGVCADIVFRSDDNGTVQAMVGAGVGWALVPRLAVDEDDPRVQVLDVRDVDPRRIGLAWHRDRHRTAPARRFVELAVELCSPLRAAA
ncbi:MAG: LysR family transcriptional regulator [Actinobacteria bacterium]|nr:LysR family transcriptional regulator [Actinomycetota bacterium]